MRRKQFQFNSSCHVTPPLQYRKGQLVGDMVEHICTICRSFLPVKAAQAELGRMGKAISASTQVSDQTMPRPVQNSNKSHGDTLSRNNNIWIQCVRCWASSSFLPRRSAREFAPPNCPTGISSNDATSHWVGVRLPFTPPPDQGIHSDTS